MIPTLLAVSGEEIAAMAVVGGIVLSALSIVMNVVRSTAVTKQLEQTKREIAAYIAEGSMTPEQGERIINSGGKPEKC